MKDTAFIKRMKRYVRLTAEKENDIPTVAGLANYLDTTKEEIFKLAKSNTEIGQTVRKTLNEIEHSLIVMAAFKKISGTAVNLLLVRDFGGKKEEDEDFELSFSVEER